MSGDEAEIHIPKAWGQGRMERKRHNSFSLDIWNYGSEIFTGASNIPAQPGSLGFSSRVSQDAVIGYNYDQLLGSQLEKGPDIPPANLGFSSGRTVSKNENQSKPYVLPQLRDAPTQTVSHNAASRIPSATPHQVHQSSERKSSLFQDSSAIPQINPFAYAQRLSFAKIGGTSRNRPNMERRASDSDQLSSSWKGEGFCWRKKDSPIGIFIWGFPFELKVYNLLDNFSGFGEIRNIGFNTKFGTRYAFIDFENVKCIHDAFHIIPQRKFFGVKLQVRYRYDKLSVPNFDIPNRQGPVKGFTGDNLTVKLCDLPPSMNKAELELHLGPVSPYLKIKVLTRAVDRKSSAFVTFATREMAQAAVQYLRKNSFLKNRQPLEIEYPAHDSTETDLDKKTVHITNLPHNVNKPDIEAALSMFGHLNRIKIFQKAPEKCSSVFITFKSVFEAQRAATYLQRDDVAVFAGMTEKIFVEYPTQDISRNPPVFISTNSVGLSKKARKQMAAENKIAYCRSPEPFTVDYLKSQLAVHGPCEVYITKSDAPWTAFVVFSTPAQCAAALAAKTMGCNLPRHKRVDFQIGGHTEKELLTYLSPIGEFKNVSLEHNTCMIEFLTALGAAKAIVHTKTVPFFGQQLVADYSPSANKEGQLSEFDSVSSAADTTTTAITGSLQRRQRENYLSEQFGTREIVIKAALQETSIAEPYYHRNRTMSLDALGTNLSSKFSISNPVKDMESFKESDQYSLFGTHATAMLCPISPSSHPRASLSNESSINCSSPPSQLEYEDKEE